jgi:hypothetical protein
MAWRAIKSPRPYRIRVSGRASRRARGAYCRALIAGGRVAIITRAGGHYHQGGGRVGYGSYCQIVSRKHCPRKHGSDCHGVLIWVKLSNSFDMGQIVIFFLVTPFSFLRGNFRRRARKHRSNCQIVTPNKSLAYNIGRRDLIDINIFLINLKMMTI